METAVGDTGLGGYVNEDLGRISDLLYGSSEAVYVIAGILFLVALAISRADVPNRERELVGAASGGGSTALPDERTPGKLAAPTRRGMGDRIAGMAYPVVFLGLLAHIASITLRGVATDRAPWGNMYEFISLTCAACVVAALVALRRDQLRPLLAFVILPVALLMFIGGSYLYTQAAPVMPALKSAWLAIHVSVISISSGILLTSGIASLLFLAKVRWQGSPNEADAERSSVAAFFHDVIDRLPSADTLDRIAYKSVIVGFPLFGLGVIFGAIWAESAWGRFWGWDPKETVSFIAWIVYAAYLHARATAGWRNAAAWINVGGFVALLFNLFAINLVVSGLHSYAGL